MIVQAQDFANQMSATPDSHNKATAYTFGTDKDRSANALRRLADAIERGEALIQSVRVLSLTQEDNYSATTLRLLYHERTPLDAPEPDEAVQVKGIA